MATTYRIVDNSQETLAWLTETFPSHPLSWDDWGPKDVVEDMITYMIAQGWQPQGGVAIANVGAVAIYQAMTKTTV
jgi:hypothetical protein